MWSDDEMQWVKWVTNRVSLFFQNTMKWSKVSYSAVLIAAALIFIQFDSHVLASSRKSKYLIVASNVVVPNTYYQVR